MLWLLLFVAPIALIVYVSVHKFHRAMAKAEADRIIDGIQPATEEQISKCITRIRQQSYWFRDVTELDNQRINRLRDIREEMATPHG